MEPNLLKRYDGNPILKPDPNHSWENFGTFNGSIIKVESEYFLFYRAMGDEISLHKIKFRPSVIGKAQGVDGKNFEKREIFIKPEYVWEEYGCEDPRVVKVDNQYLIFYTCLANYPPTEKGIKIAVAVSPDLKTVKEKHRVTPFNAKAMVLFPEKIDNLYTAILTVDTDNPPSHVGIAQFENLSDLWNMEYWLEWYKNLDEHWVHLRRVNSDQVEIGAAPIKTEHGWMLIYSYIKHYLSENVKKQFRIESVLLDLKDPKKIVGRIEKPILMPEADYEINGNVNNIVFPEGAIVEGGFINVYYGASDKYCAVASTNLPMFMANFEIGSPETLKCQKFTNNPLLEPILDHGWENVGVFNPAAVEIDNTTFLIYRAFSSDNISRLGLAISQDGIIIDERLPDPIYPLRKDFEKPRDSQKGGGTEDPRITLMDNILYLCYTSFDGVLPRLTLSSISVSDFLGRNWDKWAEPKIISPPDIADKDGALFPEKINGKYVFFHRIEPNIVIDTVSELGFAEGRGLGSKGIIAPITGTWDSVKVGINSPPIKTESGWLCFYHGISEIDRHYRIGALLLDLNDPTKIIGRTPYPILEPENIFERKGMVDNVVFPCGHVLRGDTIFLYYGGADKVVCGAKISLSRLIDYLKKSSEKKYLEF